MKTLLLYLVLPCILLFAACQSLHGQSAEMDPYLQEALQDAGDDTLVDVIVYLREEGDLQALKQKFQSEKTPVQQRPEAVMRLLKSTADASQDAVISGIKNESWRYADLRRFWIANAFAIRAEPSLILALSMNEEVARILLNRNIFAFGDEPMRGGDAAKSAGGSEPGLVAAGAPEMWAMGYTGRGRLAMTFDTGIWDYHPALKDRFLGNHMPYSSTWFAYDSPVPIDKSSSHGTHVTGIMLGLDTATSDTIGMAPEAYFIATDPVVSNLALVKPLTDFMFGYEWALNPDGDESTFTDIPDVINNSWGFGPDLDEAPCPEFVIPVFTALEVAGIANVFSAGNEGPGDLSISVPHNTNIGLVNSFTVGAVSSNAPHPIASFSSRGPSQCGGSGSILIKPEVSAPGVNVRSAVEFGGYDLYSGTSMASPHVSGAVLLLKEAFPFLSGEEILLALYYSATDLGDEGEDNTYGMGMINVKHAFDYLSTTHEPVPPAASGVDLALVEITHPQMDIISCVDSEAHHFAPSLTIRNKGSVAVESFTIRYGFEDGPTFEEAFSTAIPPGEEAVVTLPEVTDPVLGARAFHVYIAPLEDEYDVYNNHKISRWIALPHYDWEADGPIAETFDGGLDSTFWTVYNPDGGITWDTVSVVQIDGNIGPAARMNHHRYFNIRGQKDHLVSPLIRNVPADHQVLSFDYFYRKREHNPFTMDTLLVTLTRICGDTYPGEELFHAGGEDLFTVTQTQQNALPETPGQWSTMSFDLEFDAGDAFYFSFITLNRNGNHMVIDNVRINDGTGTRQAGVGPEVGLHPNPAGGTVRATWTGKPANITIYDIAGRAVHRREGADPGIELHLDGLSQGMYTVGFEWPEGTRSTGKLVIR